METIDEIKKLNGNEYISEVSKIILFDNRIKDFLKWTKLELLTFYNEWKSYDIFDKGGDYQLTMKSTKHRMRIIVGDVLLNMIHQVVSDGGRISNISRKDIMDYITTKRRETLIDELIN